MNRIILAALLATGVAASAQAQTYQDSGGTVVPGVVPIQPGVGPLFTSANPGKISGSFSASLSGFQPTPSYASLSVGATSGRVALPSGTVVVIYNTGSNAAFVTLGGSSVVATAANDVIQPNSWMAFTVGSATYLAGIETAGATTLNLSGGSGLPTGAGGGGGGGGGSNASVGSTGSAIPASATLGGMSVGGTMTAMPGTSNGLKIDGSAVTQPISAAGLPLPTGAATAAGQPTVAGSGSTTSGQTGNLDMAAVTSSSPAYTNGQTNPLSLTTAGALRIDGSAVTQPVSAASLPLPSGAATAANQTSWQGATGTAAPGNASYSGARAENAEPSPASNGNLTGLAVGLEGKLITLPFANKENMVRGTASQTGTSATTLIAAQGSGIKIYVTGVQCKNTGSATTIVTLNDNETTGSGTVLIVPTSGGDNEVYQTPLAVAANTALTFTPSAASSTVYCNAQGYAGS
jgi:hypothetical protein